MAFAGLYQITGEMIRHAVVDKVRDFYWGDIEDNGAMSAENQEQQYRLQVLALARKEFTASLLWLVQSKAITQAQADRLGAVHAHRNELTHELVRYMVDADADPDIELLAEALAILKDLHRFWVDVELSTGWVLPAQRGGSRRGRPRRGHACFPDSPAAVHRRLR
jgi:hypothetical protein